MDGSLAESTHSLEPIVLKLLRKLMKPVKVSGLVFTKCGRLTVRGIILTKSPTERRETARDFEVGGFRGGSIGYVAVEGKKVFLRTTNDFPPFEVSESPLRGIETNAT